jgi:hypothetical protein
MLVKLSGVLPGIAPMIAATSATFTGSLDYSRAWNRVPARGLRLAVIVPVETLAGAAARPDPRPVAGSLDQLLYDGEPAATRPLALEARRGFAAGNGFLAGQIVDRSA